MFAPNIQVMAIEKRTVHVITGQDRNDDFSIKNLGFSRLFLIQFVHLEINGKAKSQNTFYSQMSHTK